MFKIRKTVTILAQCKQEKVDGDLVLGILGAHWSVRLWENLSHQCLLKVMLHA